MTRFAYLSSLTGLTGLLALSAFACGTSNDAAPLAAAPDAGDTTDARADDATGADASTGDVHVPPTPRVQGGAFCVAPGYCWENPRPQGFTLTGVHGTAPDDVWAVGLHGTIMWWGGKGWAHVPSRTMTPLRGVFAASRDDVWIVGDRSTLLHWDGLEVSATPSPPEAKDFDYVGIWGSSPRDVWVLGRSQGPLARATTLLLRWNGTAWSSTPLPWTHATRIWGTAADDVWVAASTPGGDAQHFDGLVWKSTIVGSIYEDTQAFWREPGASGGTWVVRSGNMPAVIGLLDGASWEPRYSGYERLHAIWGSSRDDVWAVGPRALVHWNGASWTPESNVGTPGSPTSQIPPSIWGAGRDDVWQVGDRGFLAHLTHGAWGRATAGILSQAGSVVKPGGADLLMGSGPDDVWHIVDWTALHYDGTTWTEVPVPDVDEWMGLWVAGRSDAWLLGYTGNVLHWDGSAWAQLGKLELGSKAKIWASRRDDVWVSTKTALHHWDGRTWTKREGEGGGEYAVWGASPNDMWMTGETGLTRVQGGLAQPRRSLEIDIRGGRAIWGRTDDDVWVVGDGGMIWHFDGAGWRSTSSGTSADLTGVWGSGPNDVYATAGELFPHDGRPVDPGVLLHWDGNVWSKVEGVEGMSSVWGADARNVWLGTSTGGVLRRKP